jgi:hypothetical protein
MRVSWRNLDWVGETDRGEIEKKLAGIGGEGSTLLDRVEFIARDPAQLGAPFEVRITGNVAKNQITAVRREATAQAAFRSALDAFERSAVSVWSMRSAAPTKPPVPAPAQLRPQPVAPPPAALVPRWRPEVSLPRLNLSLDRQALFARLAQPTRGALRVASSLLPMRRALVRQTVRNLDRDRAEALERMGWRERLATLAMWNEVEAAERWAREQVFARRYRSELEKGGSPVDPAQIDAGAGWRERIADLSLWTELEAAERWAREQVMARLRRGQRGELGDVESRQIPARAASRGGSARWRGRLADLSLWDALESFELRLRNRSRARAAREAAPPGPGLFARISNGFSAIGGLVRAPAPVHAFALGLAGVVGLWAFQGVSNTDGVAQASLDAAYSAIAIPESWAQSDTPFSAIAVPPDWERDGTPFSAVAVPLGTALASADVASPADWTAAYSAIALPALSIAQQTVLDDGAALRD